MNICVVTNDMRLARFIILELEEAGYTATHGEITHSADLYICDLDCLETVPDNCIGFSLYEEKREKVKQAIALEYDPQDNAPKVIASGRGILAEKIIEKAKEADVPVHRDDKLADTLSRLEIGDMIPPELYEAVAEILVFVDSMDKLKAKLKK